MAALDLNLYARMGRRRNISIYTQVPVSVRSKETENIRALDWYPGPVVFPLQLNSHATYKQRRLILQIWDILHNDFFSLSEMSDMDLD